MRKNPLDSGIDKNLGIDRDHRRFVFRTHRLITSKLCGQSVAKLRQDNTGAIFGPRQMIATLHASPPFAIVRDLRIQDQKPDLHLCWLKTPRSTIFPVFFP